MKMIPLPPRGWIDSLPGPILVTGAGGMLGWEWVRALEQQGAGSRVLPMGRAELDVTKEDAIRRVFELHRPALVIHCAAYTNVDKAESEKEAADLGNAVASGLLAKACHGVGAKLVYYSTDQVFDGTGQVAREEGSTPRPLNAYGISKWSGVRAALEAPGTLVLRVQWLYGERKDRFAVLKSKSVFTPFSDQWGAPTWTRDVVEGTLALLGKKAEGIFHLTYDNYGSWAQVFQRVKEKWNLPVRLEPKATKEFSLPAQRPLFSVLSNRKFCRALALSGVGTWEDALDEFLDMGEPKGDPTHL